MLLKSSGISRQASLLAFAAFLVLLGVLLLALIGNQTKWIDGLRLAAQPRMLPLVSLIVMTAFAALFAYLCWRDGQEASADHSIEHELLYWIRPAEYLLYFMIYVSAVTAVGYGFSTILFCFLVSLRAGCGLRQACIAAAVAVLIVAIFKGLLSANIPGAVWYESLPEPLRTFLLLNF